MPYSAKINRANPSCFLFVIDESGSMDESMESGRSKAQFVADVLNKTLAALIPQCTKADGVRAYFDVGVITYSGFGVGSGLGGNLSEGILHPISVINKNPIRIEEHNRKVEGGMISRSLKFPVWFEPRSLGGTPMREALTKAAEVLAEWSANHPHSYPPTLIHVTDGQSTDGNPEAAAAALQQIATSDGQCLIFNLHFNGSSDGRLAFPACEDELPDQYSKLLFKMSSPFPPHLVEVAQRMGYRQVTAESRFFMYKASTEFIVHFFDIGTRTSQIHEDNERPYDAGYVRSDDKKNGSAAVTVEPPQGDSPLSSLFLTPLPGWAGRFGLAHPRLRPWATLLHPSEAEKEI